VEFATYQFQPASPGVISSQTQGSASQDLSFAHDAGNKKNTLCFLKMQGFSKL
jgi:hypothetical protein